jgi:hypothetical protein
MTTIAAAPVPSRRGGGSWIDVTSVVGCGRKEPSVLIQSISPGTSDGLWGCLKRSRMSAAKERRVAWRGGRVSGSWMERGMRLVMLRLASAVHCARLRARMGLLSGEAWNVIVSVASTVRLLPGRRWRIREAACWARPPRRSERRRTFHLVV